MQSDFKIKNSENLPKTDDKCEAHDREKLKQIEISIYLERNNNYKILTNRLKILQHSQKQFPNMRTYNSREVKKYCDYFDPIRAKLRIMP